MVKKMRATLIEKAKPLLFQVIGDITASKVVNLYTDISTASDERVLMFELEQSLESQLARRKCA